MFSGCGTRQEAGVDAESNLTAAGSAAKPITIENFANHPRIVAIKAVVSDGRRAEAHDQGQPRLRWDAKQVLRRGWYDSQVRGHRR